jgi:hypothetical protein
MGAGGGWMGRGYFIGCSLLGLAAALAIFFPLGAKRRARIPLRVLWLCLILGGVACMYSLFHSTAPSFATRITAVGKAYDHFERQQGRDTSYGFRFVPEGGVPISVETEIILPNWGTPAIFNGQTFRIVYLDHNKRTLKNEAIDIAILSGKNAGFHDSFDARPGGVWLGIPVGAGLCAFGFFGLKYRKDDARSAASGDNDARSITRADG